MCTPRAWKYLHNRWSARANPPRKNSIRIDIEARSNFSGHRDNSPDAAVPWAACRTTRVDFGWVRSCRSNHQRVDQLARSPVGGNEQPTEQTQHRQAHHDEHADRGPTLLARAQPPPPQMREHAA